MMNRRTPKLGKLVASLTLLVGGYLCAIQHSRPFRATSDEALVTGDLQYVLQTGHLADLSYFSGAGYQTITTILLTISGTQHNALQYLSPLLATISFGILFTSGALIIREYDIHQEGILISFCASIFIFGGFVSRIIESTHKKYTFSLVFLSLFIGHSIISSDKGNKQYILLFIFLSAIGLYNYVWGAVYTAVVGVGFIVAGPYSTRAFLLSAGSGILSVSTPKYNPVTRYHRQYIDTYQRFINRIFQVISSGNPFSDNPSSTDGNTTPSTDGNTTPSTDGNTTPSNINITDSPPLLHTTPSGGTIEVILAKINQWPSISLLGFSISTWYIYSSGIFSLAILSILASFSALWLCYFNNTPPIAPQYLGIIIVTGVFFVLFVIMGDVATLKRIIVLPGVFSVLILSVVATRSNLSSRQVTTVLIVITLIGAGLATPRTLPDGGQSPVDMYGGEESLSSGNWLEAYGGAPSCYGVASPTLSHVLSKRLGYVLPVYTEGYYNLIYSGGEGSEIYTRC